MPSDIHRNYGNNVAAIYRDMGRAKAEARLQQGQGWANAIGNIGQTIAAIPGQMQEQKQQEMRSALTDLQMQEVRSNLERAKQQDAQTMAIANLVSQATVNGQFDKDAFATAAAAQGMAQIVPQVVKTFAEMEQSLIDLESAEKTGLLTDAKLAELQQDFLRPLALNLWENKFEPSVVNGVFAAARAMGTPEELVSQWEQMPPEQLSLVVQQLLPSAKAPEAVTLSEGQVRFSPQTDSYGRPVMGPDGQPAMTRMEGNAKPQTLDEMLAAALKAGNRDEVNRIIKTKAQEAAATRAPQAPKAPSYSWALDPKTNEVVYATDDQILRDGLKPAPTADMRNKDAGKKTAAIAVDAVRKLGDGIFTKVGPAQRAQSIKRGTEAVFGNDPEFRTYQDSRMALAGTLAVEQQGGRVSDADVKALWLPMVPDAYRDTKESYKLKWDLIDAMRGKDPASAPSGGVKRYDMNGNEIIK